MFFAGDVATETHQLVLLKKFGLYSNKGDIPRLNHAAEKPTQAVEEVRGGEAECMVVNWHPLRQIYREREEGTTPQKLNLQICIQDPEGELVRKCRTEVSSHTRHTHNDNHAHDRPPCISHSFHAMPCHGTPALLLYQAQKEVCVFDTAVSLRESVKAFCFVFSRSS